MFRHRLPLGVCWFVLAVGCGSSSSTPSPAPTPPAAVVNLAGTWTGTLDVPDVPSRSVTLTVVQGGNCVDGSWVSVPAGWSGAISGFAGTDSYSGQVSFERADDQGGRCTATGTLVGPVSGNTLQWTVRDFAPITSCSGQPPKLLTFTLQRQ